MREVLAAIRAADPARPAVSDEDGVLTYGALAEAIAASAGRLADAPATVGVMMPRSRAHVVADLALASLGRTIVPLPDFFSLGLLAHLAADAGIGAVVTVPELADRVAPLGIPVLDGQGRDARLVADEPSRRIVYTSGTTGRPKGVVLDEAAMGASLAGLGRAAEASAADVHLSLLPFSLLLEQLAGVLLPLRVGARLHVGSSPLDAEAVGATTSVVVPSLLAAWVGALAAMGRRAPASLRFVAVGGAPVGEALAAFAVTAGLPVHEGYGLSECCSVVAVNRPGQRRAGTVGRPLDGVEVAIEDGEIVVRGPTVMAGYLGHGPAGGVWRTGDLGRFDEAGNLVVLGRKDDVVVTPDGRNVHPEWIEPMLLADPAVRACAVVPGDDGIKAVVVPADPGAPADSGHWLPILTRLSAAAPAYARPAEVAVVPAEMARALALFTADGRPRRRHIAQTLRSLP